MGAFLDGLGGAFNLAVGVFCIIMIVLILLLVRWAGPRMWRSGRGAKAQDRSWATTHGVLVDAGRGAMSDTLERHRGLVAAGAAFNPDDALHPSDSGPNAGPFVIYRFMADGRERVGGDLVAAPLGTKIGDRFDVSYNPADPEQNRGTAEHRSRFRWWAGASIVVVAVLLGCAWMFGVMAFEAFRRFAGQ